MKLKNRFVLLLALLGMWSCKNDDDDDITEVELQTLSETAIENDAEIQAYLQSHFYELVDSQIILDTIAGDNSDKTPLSESILSETISLSPSDLSLEEDDDSAVNHTLYYLIAESGSENGAFVTVADSTFLNYEGLGLDGEVFDSSTGSPVWFDFLSSGFIEGFQQGLTKFREGGAAVENGDGTFTIEEPSIGLIIMPSGLGYFSGTSGTGESYSPLIFKVNVIRTINADHDGDGITTLLEDLNNNGDYLDDDTDEDSFPNFVDSDDDGDNILTSDEITVNSDGTITYPDSDGDGTPDYLDSDS